MTIRTIRTNTTVKAIPATRRRGQLYSDVAWQKASAAWVRQYPVCVLCLARGEINAGSLEDTCTRQRTLVVDHIEPHGGDINRFWDQANWQTLCRTPCHDVHKQQHERRGGTAATWIKYLRDEMVKHNATQKVEQMRQWLPKAMYTHMVGYTSEAPPRGRGSF